MSLIQCASRRLCTVRFSHDSPRSSAGFSHHAAVVSLTVASPTPGDAPAECMCVHALKHTPTQHSTALACQQVQSRILAKLRCHNLHSWLVAAAAESRQPPPPNPLSPPLSSLHKRPRVQSRIFTATRSSYLSGSHRLKTYNPLCLNHEALLTRRARAYMDLTAQIRTGYSIIFLFTHMPNMAKQCTK